MFLKKNRHLISAYIVAFIAVLATLFRDGQCLRHGGPEHEHHAAAQHRAGSRPHRADVPGAHRAIDFRGGVQPSGVRKDAYPLPGRPGHPDRVKAARP